MKLSAAIEKMLVTGVYKYLEDEYMCCVLNRHNLEEHVSAVQDMVQTIKPNVCRNYPLACALHDADIYSLHVHTNREMFEFCKQLYCWWVFDLKRKGL